MNKEEKKKKKNEEMIKILVVYLVWFVFNKVG